MSNCIRIERLKFRGTQHRLNTAVVLIDEWKSCNVLKKEHATTTPGIHVSCLPNISLNAIFYTIWIAEILQNIEQRQWNKRFGWFSFSCSLCFWKQNNQQLNIWAECTLCFVACVTPWDDTLIGAILEDRCISEMWCTFQYLNGCSSRRIGASLSWRACVSICSVKSGRKCAQHVQIFIYDDMSDSIHAAVCFSRKKEPISSGLLASFNACPNGIFSE